MDCEAAYLVGTFMGNSTECIYTWDRGAVDTINGVYTFLGNLQCVIARSFNAQEVMPGNVHSVGELELEGME